VGERDQTRSIPGGDGLEGQRVCDRQAFRKRTPAPTRRQGRTWWTWTPAKIARRLAASLPLLPAVDELGRRPVDVIGIRGAQEVPAALDDAQLGTRAVDEELGSIMAAVPSCSADGDGWRPARRSA
jgi:hypothetical protein